MLGFEQLEAQVLYLEPIKYLCGSLVTTCDFLFPHSQILYREQIF